MAYVEVAQELAAALFRFVTRLPKRYDYRLGDPLFAHAEEVVFHTMAANETYVNSDAAFDQRRCHLNEANAELTHVESLLAICHEVTLKLSQEGQSRPPNANMYERFAETIARERKLIAGCKRADTQAYNRKREAGSADGPATAAVL